MEKTRRSNRTLAAAVALAALAFVSLPTAAANDRAVVTRKRVIIIRTGKLTRDFPHKKRAVVNLPVVGGISDPRVLRKVRASLDTKNVFGSSLAEYRQDAWLEELDFKVNYNKNHVLDITMWQTGTGAYPDTHSVHLAFNLRTGDLLGAADVFKPDALPELARMANEKLRAEVNGLVQSVEQDKSADAEQRQSIKEDLSRLSFNVEHLNTFMVGDRGLTFIYDAGFPHVIQALEPDGRYFFTYAQLAPYVKRDGPLGRFVK